MRYPIPLIASNILLANAQSQSSRLDKISCQHTVVYQNPNASASYAIPAVKATATEDNSIGITTSSTANWTLTNVLSQSKDFSSTDQHPILEQAVFLDTSSTLKNSSSAAKAGLIGCAIYFTLPTFLTTDVAGDCTLALGEDCVNEFVENANKAALSVAQSQTSPGISICDKLQWAVTANLSRSCRPFKDSDVGVTSESWTWDPKPKLIFCQVSTSHPLYRPFTRIAPMSPC